MTKQLEITNSTVYVYIGGNLVFLRVYSFAIFVRKKTGFSLR